MAYYDGWRPYVSVGQRRANAEREMQKLKKKGHAVSPVAIDGRTIVTTFWGKAWCENLERYSDYENRLPRGRTYVRNGSVVDLQVSPGEIKAYVGGSDLYKISVKIAPVSKARWQSICSDCAGAIDSLVELLQGRFSKGVMERICRQHSGLFPSPKEITLACSCPDSAGMCKHIAAVMYGIGARLDKQPELLFRLHNVDEQELIAQAGRAIPLTKAAASAKVLGGEDLSDLFGLEMALDTGSEAALSAKPKREKAAAAKSVAGTAKKAVKRPKKSIAKRKAVPKRKG